VLFIAFGRGIGGKGLFKQTPEERDKRLKRNDYYRTYRKKTLKKNLEELREKARKRYSAKRKGKAKPPRKRKTALERDWEEALKYEKRNKYLQGIHRRRAEANNVAYEEIDYVALCLYYGGFCELHQYHWRLKFFNLCKVNFFKEGHMSGGTFSQCRVSVAGCTTQLTLPKRDGGEKTIPLNKSMSEEF
jgi:hypothetical protein